MPKFDDEDILEPSDGVPVPPQEKADFSDLPPPEKPSAFNLMTSKGPLNWQPAPPQEDPLPYPMPTNPNVEARNNEGPFFYAGGGEMHRDLSPYLLKMLGDRMKPGSGYDQSITTMMRLGDLEGASPSAQYLDNPMTFERFYSRHDPLSIALGIEDLDKYGQQFQMPDIKRDRNLRYEMSEAEYEAKKRSLPDYLQRRVNQEAEDFKNKMDPASRMAMEAIDRRGNVMWQGDTAPTQRDIDIINAKPSDSVLEQFEEQFGQGSVGKYAEWGDKQKPAM
jgi:hypothetical protein